MTIYLYTYSGSNSNLCAPYLSSALWINPQYYNIITDVVHRTISPTIEIRKQSFASLCNLLGTLNHLRTIHSTYKLSPPYLLTSHAISSDYITYYGHDVSISKIETSLTISIKAKLTELEVEDYQQVKELKSEVDLKTVEGFISYAYTNILRQRYFDNYHLLYPSLGLKNNVGHKTIQHIEELGKLKYLPHFYIWQKVVDLYNEIDCKWLQRELIKYGNVK